MYMLKSILASIFGLSIIGIIYLLIKILKKHSDKKLLDKISDDVKTELRRYPSYLLMNEETKREFKKLNIKEVLVGCVFWEMINLVAFLLFYVTSIIITGKGDTSLWGMLLWSSVPPALIFAYFAVKDGLRVARFREIYEIRAYCAKVNTVEHSKEVSLIYYDYKKMQYCITSVILSAGHDDWGYSTRFCWAMAVEKRESVKVIDVSPRVYEKEGNKR